MLPAKSNPFSTRFVEPGAIEWISSHPEQTIERLLSRFLSIRRAAIVGPHGAGKSTLVHHLLAASARTCVTLRADQLDIARVEIDRQFIDRTEGKGEIPNALRLILRGRSQSIRVVRSALRRTSSKTWIVLDGFEQLPIWMRWWIHFRCWARDQFLLVTSHRRTTLSTLIEVEPQVDLLAELIEQLVVDHPELANRFSQRDALQASLDRHRGSIREVFMELYDECESMRAHSN